MSDVTKAVRKMRFPKWLVTSRNGRFERTEPGEVRWAPFGVRHARQVGSGWTACGQPAIEWKFFWDMPFTRSTNDKCEACCLAVAGNGAQASRGDATPSPDHAVVAERTTSGLSLGSGISRTEGQPSRLVRRRPFPDSAAFRP
jgi:hypothetical protein